MNFKQFLQEKGPQWLTSDFDLAFREVPHIPALPKLQEIFKRNPITVFRISSLNGLERLIKNQRKPGKSVPSFTRLEVGHDLSMGVISANTGVITELEGIPLAQAPDDMMTIPDQHDVRWFSADSEVVQRDIKKIQASLKSRMDSDLTQEEKSEIMKEFYNLFISGVKKNIEEYSKEFFKPRGKTYDDWDEVIVSNFEVKRAWLLKDVVHVGQGTKIQDKYWKKIDIKWIDQRELKQKLRSRK